MEGLSASIFPIHPFHRGKIFKIVRFLHDYWFSNVLQEQHVSSRFQTLHSLLLVVKSNSVAQSQAHCLSWFIYTVILLINDPFLFHKMKL